MSNIITEEELINNIFDDLNNNDLKIHIKRYHQYSFRNNKNTIMFMQTIVSRLKTLDREITQSNINNINAYLNKLKNHDIKTFALITRNINFMNNYQNKIQISNE